MSGQNRARDDKRRKEKRTKRNAETTLAYRLKVESGAVSKAPSAAK